MAIPEALAPELLVLGHVVLRGVVAVTSAVRWLRAPHVLRRARARLRPQLAAPESFEGNFPGRTMWGPTLYA